MRVCRSVTTPTVGGIEHRSQRLLWDRKDEALALGLREVEPPPLSCGMPAQLDAGMPQCYDADGDEVPGFVGRCVDSYRKLGSLRSSRPSGPRRPGLSRCGASAQPAGLALLHQDLGQGMAAPLALRRWRGTRGSSMELFAPRRWRLTLGSIRAKMQQNVR